MSRDIGQLNVKVGLDSTGFQSGVTNLNREMKRVQSQFRLASSEIGKHGSELDARSEPEEPFGPFQFLPKGV